MKETVTFTQDDANSILAMLSDLPIKYLSTVQAVQNLLTAKFTDDIMAKAPIDTPLANNKPPTAKK